MSREIRGSVFFTYRKVLGFEVLDDLDFIGENRVEADQKKLGFYPYEFSQNIYQVDENVIMML